MDGLVVYDLESRERRAREGLILQMKKYRILEKKT